MENNSNGGFFSGIVTAILVAVAFIWGILWWCIVTFVRFAILTLALVFIRNLYLSSQGMQAFAARSPIAELMAILNSAFCTV
jgi:hypothetical protein